MLNPKNPTKRYGTGLTTKNINALSIQRPGNGDAKVGNFSAKGKGGVREGGYTGIGFRKEAGNG
jgi:hypothetical protein